MARWLLSLFIFFCCLDQCWTAATQFSVKAGSWSFATENVRSTNQSSSGLGAYAFEFGYALHPHWILNIALNILMSDGFSGSSGYGFDLGTKYYPFTQSTASQLETETATLLIQELWRPYVGLFIRQRTFGLALTTSYLGPGLSLGLDYCLTKNWLLSAEFRYDYLYGQGDALAIQNNFLLGIGFEF